MAAPSQGALPGTAAGAVPAVRPRSRGAARTAWALARAVLLLLLMLPSWRRGSRVGDVALGGE
eukprot:12775520-Alexandrium_andersonii.AAC.1